LSLFTSCLLLSALDFLKLTLNNNTSSMAHSNTLEISYASQIEGVKMGYKLTV